jgi:hypothetical protein
LAQRPEVKASDPSPFVKIHAIHRLDAGSIDFAEVMFDHCRSPGLGAFWLGDEMDRKMNWKVRALCASLILASASSAVVAQQTAPGQYIPAEAQKAILHFHEDGQITLNGAPIRLSAAVQIRGTDNLIVLSQSLHGRYLVRALLDSAGFLHRAWIINGNQ